MKLPFDDKLITHRINAFKTYLDKIIDCPTISFHELSKKTKKRGLYLIFEGDELMYIGMTESSEERFKHLTSQYPKHTFNRKKLAEHLRGKNIFRKNGDTIHVMSKKIAKELIDDEIITFAELKQYRKEVNALIKTFKFKFYETDLIYLKDFEHFTIAVLEPPYND